MTFRIREFHPVDTDALLALWEESKRSGYEPVYSIAEVLASCEKDHAVVAVVDNKVVGAAVARAAHEQGWIVFFWTLEPMRRQGIGSALLSALENRLTPLGLTKLSILVPDGQHDTRVLDRAGFVDRNHLSYYERELPMSEKERSTLNELGGRLLPPDLWTSIAGMQNEKQLLERRLVLPLQNPETAETYGVEAPRAIVLFGPPGTGKTTFAKAVASRLNWPFVEVFPARLSGDSRGLAGALRETFTKISELDNVVVFIDEVEEIASHRKGEPPAPTQGVTNELLKLIPMFREGRGRLLIVATNFIRALDAAFLRHGRFDYVIPIGLPDEDARRSIWTRYIPPQSLESVDLDRLVERTDGFSPADIEYAARKGSQRALEEAVYQDGGRKGPSTDDYDWAIGQTRMTVSKDVAEDFLVDIDELARL
ncbi:MAG: ATP-dependent zinc metalloprotease FtsH 2 [Cellulomonadaceae bacterium TMED98]|nr:MAG: ATP-dependent zinc metalloprotease FtsH 2 [Cellulomonadaceae bacterium TMED98]